jgi:hypothetical protein
VYDFQATEMSTNLPQKRGADHLTEGTTADTNKVEDTNEKVGQAGGENEKELTKLEGEPSAKRQALDAVDKAKVAFTEGLETVKEKVGEIMADIKAPSSTEGAGAAPSGGILNTVKEQLSTGIEKGKELLNEGIEKGKELLQKTDKQGDVQMEPAVGTEAAKPGLIEQGIEKGKELLEAGKQQVEGLLGQKEDVSTQGKESSEGSLPGERNDDEFPHGKHETSDQSQIGKEGEKTEAVKPKRQGRGGSKKGAASKGKETYAEAAQAGAQQQQQQQQPDVTAQ